MISDTWLTLFFCKKRNKMKVVRFLNLEGPNNFHGYTAVYNSWSVLLIWGLCLAAAPWNGNYASEILGFSSSHLVDACGLGRRLDTCTSCLATPLGPIWIHCLATPLKESKYLSESSALEKSPRRTKLTALSASSWATSLLNDFVFFTCSHYHS